ncbi:MAG: PAS domain S-box protein [Deltaproteobacteria bacterium]|nr:PAS domain S-box protein [Deltaproteobacteria bacterium]
MKADPKRRIPTPAISWEAILTSLEDGVIVIDPRGKVSFMNQAAESLVASSAAALQQPYTRLFRKNPWLLSMIENSQPPHLNSTRGDSDFVNLWGRRAPVSASVSPLQDQYGRSLGTILLLRDITRRREMEEDLKRSDRLATLGTLAAGLAHEIKNPLGGIKGAAQLLRRALARDPSLLEYAEIMIREVDRVNLLIEQLLDLSRPTRLNLTMLNIHELLDQVLLLERETAQEKKIDVRKRFDPSLPTVYGDRPQLIQVFLNLIKNAFQAMNKQGCLTITTRMETDFHIREEGKEPGKFIWVEIQDNGVGIKEEDLPHIFSPFFTTKNNGTGLGLAICYRIIKEHGGLIRVESREGEGAAFRVSLRVTA